MGTNLGGRNAIEDVDLSSDQAKIQCPFFNFIAGIPINENIVENVLFINPAKIRINQNTGEPEQNVSLS